jgi:glycosyltransferase involved in cell wall biosynthesis
MITVIMPCYNSQCYIEEACRSILDQTYTNWTLLAIDDGSSDSTLSILRSFSDTRIKIVQNKTNQGIVYCLNKGISLSEGKYIARMDSDDISKPDRLEKQLDFMESHQEIGVCGGQVEFISEKYKNAISDYPLHNSKIREAFLYSNPIPHPAAMIRRETILHSNGYCNTFQYGASIEDYDLWLRLALKRVRFANLSCIVLEYRIREDSVTGQSLKAKTLFNACRLCLLEKLMDSTTITRNGLVVTNRSVLTQNTIRKWIDPNSRIHKIETLVAYARISRFICGKNNITGTALFFLQMLLNYFR